jgi:hypothetical protein
MKRLYIFIVFAGLIGELQSQTVNDLSWILGSWVMKSEGFELTETWTKTNEALYIGKGIGLTGKDTVFQEEMQLSFRENGIFYIVKAQAKTCMWTWVMGQGHGNSLIVSTENPLQASCSAGHTITQGVANEVESG